MTKIILSTLLLSFSLIMLFLNNPLSMGLMILIQTILSCLMSGMLIKTYWFSYILFLIFLGGLLVLFIYVSSIASNELFNPSMNLKMSIIFLMLFIFNILYFKINKMFLMNLSFNSDMDNLFLMKNLFINNNFNTINLNKIYNNHTFLIMLMLVIYLFITLIAVIKITNIFYGPLRSMF
uniref:NADH dehydrogenase subunit 6 n=1 Tax=Gynaephora rossii TaxID=1496476 RepID=UPI00203683DF|nr:NADH dehydrogenase subunit 6 [Gynaephora rossii]YP_010403106.1 NADH dehydrogenase subunit 6 [Gynaephora groenlandica]UQW19914.1 NADH dehydrogenase subunit 6 [Gynaephora rossii]UQW19927.1 NADH dehydrogenase subunit 6 [Gynaephora groenlandica]